MNRTVVGLSFLVLFVVAPAFAQSLPRPIQDPLAGSRVFGVRGCVKCHAVSGVGGKIGPDLGRIQHPRSLEDLAAAMWNHLPHMAERMQQLGIDRPQLSPRKTGDLIAFLFSVNYFAPPGDLAAGRRLFREKRCIVCHQVAGTGGAVGPNLDFLGQYATPIFVAAATWNHGPAMAQAMRVRAIQRPTFTGSELGDLIAYLRSASPGPADMPLHLLPGRGEEGQRLFVEKRCVECHGQQGSRIGPVLAGRGVQRSLIQFAAALWNKGPAMAEAMKLRGISLPPLQADEMADLVAYLDVVQYFAPPGDPRRGWRVLADKGCLNCHSVSVRDTEVPLNLARMKGLESPAAITSVLWNHALVKARTGGQADVWSPCRPEEIADLMALLGSIQRTRPLPPRLAQ